MLEPPRLEMDEESNALDYLEHAVRSLGEAPSDPWAWKWVVIGLHGALYGFAVAAARGTNPDRVKTKSGKLMSFGQVFKVVQTPEMMKMNVGAKHLTLTGREAESIRSIKNTLRNPMAHYVPMSWVITLDGLPQRVWHCLEVVRRLAFETNMYVHLDEAESKQFADLVEEGKTLAYSMLPDRLKSEYSRPDQA